MLGSERQGENNVVVREDHQADKLDPNACGLAATVDRAWVSTRCRAYRCVCSVTMGVGRGEQGGKGPPGF